VCGARAAARLYFGKAPAQLSALEAAWLASALAAPRRAFEQQFLRRAPDTDAARRVLERTRDLPLAERARAIGERLVFAPIPPRLRSHSRGETVGLERVEQGFRDSGIQGFRDSGIQGFGAVARCARANA